MSILLIFLLIVFWPRVVDAQAASEHPNVVLILADDQSYRDFGFMGNPLVHTPNIDLLAAQSARYPNGYVPMSVCRPSLATLLTGLYPHQHGIHFNHPPPGLAVMRRTMTGEQYRAARASTDYLIQRVPTLPRILAEHGYACLQTGKHWEGSYQTAGFTAGMTRARPSDRLSDVTGTRQQENGDWVAHGNGDAGLVIGRETMQPIDNFIAEHSGQRPFFVWYAPFLPHTPFDAPKRFRERYADQPIPPHLLPYYAEIARFDETVGHLINSLRRHHALQHTIIVFASDNGFRPDQNNHSRQNQRSKLSQFEDGLRTPILIRYDGHTVPAEHTQLVQTIDLVPTILSAVGLAGQVTSRMSGLDLMPSAMGSQPLPERPAFGAIYPNDAAVLEKPSQHVRGKWVRFGQFKLIVPGPAEPSLPLAFYDLASDPDEQNNLAEEQGSQPVRKQLTTLLHNWWPDGDDSRVTTGDH
ncbi:MAG: sulfatase-like hydrolase/transferase [Planctomycetaceae bacterium]